MSKYVFAVILLGGLLVGFGFGGSRSNSDGTMATVAVSGGQLGLKNELPPAASSNASVTRIDSPTNVVVLDTEVFADSVDAVIGQLEALRLKGSKKAYLVITSPGGSVVAGAKLISYMDASPMEVDTVCEVICASMAAHIHQAGKQRYMVDRSILMFHPASGGTQGTIEQMLSQLTMFKGFVDRFDANAARRSGTDFAKFKSLISQELWMDSQTALSYKFTDGLAYVFLGKNKDQAFSARKTLTAKKIVTPKYALDAIPTSVRGLWENISLFSL